jgi:hypothetical protein
LNARCGLGDRTGGGECCAVFRGTAADLGGVVERLCSNILPREAVGGTGVKSVGLYCCFGTVVAPRAGCDSKPFAVLRGCCLGVVVSSLAKTLPTLPEGGRTSLSLACRSLMTGTLAAGGTGRSGL